MLNEQSVPALLNYKGNYILCSWYKAFPGDWRIVIHLPYMRGIITSIVGIDAIHDDFGNLIAIGQLY